MMVPVGTQENPPRTRFPIITLIIVLVNLLVFSYELLVLNNGGEEALNAFVTSYGSVPEEIVDGRHLSTLLTSMFVHAGFVHIIFNMIFLLVFGDNVEDRLGHGRYLLFYIAAGLGASFAQVMVDPTSQIPSVGASGAIAGVLSGYVLLFPRGMVRVLVFLGLFTSIARFPALLFIGFWFLIQFFNGIVSFGVTTAETGGVAYWAHIGGFVAGLVLAPILKTRR